MLPSPVRQRRRIGTSPTLEMMGFDLPDRPQPATVVVVAPPPPPVRLAPAFTPTVPRVATRPSPARPSDGRPSGASPGMRAIVRELWDRESAFFDDAPDLPAPVTPEMERGKARLLTRYGIVVALVVAASLGGWTTARSNALAEVATLEAAATEAVSAAGTSAANAEIAIVDITDPAAAPVALSGAAGVITDLSQAGLLLREVSTTDADPGLGFTDPVVSRTAYGDAAAAAGALEDAMGSLLTARLLLDELVALPSLSTTPGDAPDMAQELASAIAAATERAARTPGGHPELEALVADGLDRIAARAGLYAADLRSGEPVGGHLSALEAEVESLDAAIETYVANHLPELGSLLAAFIAAIPTA
ncbi:MAG: hypothetical protein JSV07_07570 [Acidimicrobiia bacterium]|nr:MAG: hypothetical protein JSV07_07570 [Acidimicrobiia bacterium]